MNIIFAGTPDFSVTALQQLLTTEHHIIAVFTQPDRKAGRGQQLTPSPVKSIALQHNIPVYQPINFKQESDLKLVQDLNADIMIVVAYGIILPRSILELPKKGCLNIHASLLPSWRGAAPIQRAILAGDKETGVTIMQMDEKLDTGDMLLVKKCDIEEDETGVSLHDKLASLGASAIVETLDKLDTLYQNRQVQDHQQSNYAKKLDKQEAQINWNSRAVDIKNMINGFNSWPVAHTCLDNKTVRLWKANLSGKLKIKDDAINGQIIDESRDGLVVKCGEGSITITELQLPGKKRILASDFINSRSSINKVFV